MEYQLGIISGIPEKLGISEHTRNFVYSNKICKIQLKFKLYFILERLIITL